MLDVRINIRCVAKERPTSAQAPPGCMQYLKRGLLIHFQAHFLLIH